MSDPEPPSLAELVERAHEVRDTELEDVTPPMYLPPSPPALTWRVKLYWFLRRCIDWIHP